MKLTPYMYEPDISVDIHKQTEKYFRENEDVKTRIEELGWIYHTIGMIVPQNMDNYWSGHFFPYMESWNELQVSYNLMCFGLYKQSFVSLRSGLELGILSVYYNINDDGHNTVKEWLRSEDDANTPRSDKVWKILLSNNNVKIFNDKHNLKGVFNNLGYLHNYVHTKGKKYSNYCGGRSLSNQNFVPNQIKKWLKAYSDIVSLVATLHLLKYPLAVVRYDYDKKFGIDMPSFGGLEEFNIDKFAKILPHEYITDIEEIAKNDIDTQKAISDIDAFPDLTEEQVEQQVIEIEKMMIKNGEGFNAWLKGQKKQLKMFGGQKFDDRTKKRIKLLRKWAKENNFLEPINIRLGWNDFIQPK